MSCCPESKPRWERRKEARPQELLAAALEQFVEKGYAATRLEDVARCAGVSKGTLYLYFTNKEELFKAVVRDSIVPAIGAAEDRIAGFQGHSGELLRQVMGAWWERIGATKASGIVKLVMAEAANFPDLARFYQEEVIERGTAMLRSLLANGVAKGEFRPVDIDAMTQVLIAPVLMLMVWKHSPAPCNMHGIDAQSFVASYLDLILHGLLPAAADA
ncbi:TetR/AcrR family transcriptional regulator [Massilia sp. TS11]|uniref:TetR/AcrR family transcriptional regulator n=1 Tax=Massilia sp. TS11 TaxID=2908003 RepID=UPI001EDB23AE|nr:TetR/AcrR family transcriptional regulator [Massilia sp. TS11]MCG2586340.1 TetR/AcrR family transcriptional regulator [Massilia sp. TS11]